MLTRTHTPCEALTVEVGHQVLRRKVTGIHEFYRSTFQSAVEPINIHKHEGCYELNPMSTKAGKTNAAINQLLDA